MLGVDLRNETKTGLLYALKAFTERATKDMPLPVKRQSRDAAEPKPRPAAVYLACLPDMASFEKKAPFILHQVVTGLDELAGVGPVSARQSRLDLKCTCVVRSVFCVYNPDGQEGGLSLLNLMEAMRTALLMFPVLNKVFELDQYEGISQRVYPETGDRGTAPYYLGEMVTQWKLPPVRRLDAARVVHGLPPMDPTAAHRTEILTEKGLETNGEKNG